MLSRSRLAYISTTSCVLTPVWGVAMTFGCWYRGSEGSAGSSWCASNPAPSMCPLCSASTKACTLHKVSLSGVNAEYHCDDTKPDTLPGCSRLNLLAAHMSCFKPSIMKWRTGGGTTAVMMSIQYLLVNDFSTRIIDDHAAAGHHRQLSRRDEAPRAWRERAVQRHKRAAAQHCLQLCTRASRCDGDHLHVQSLGRPCQPLP